MAKFDLLVKGGFLIDYASRREGRYDVALQGGRVFEVGPDLNPDHAAEVFDAQGKWVFPGLVDTHVHLTPARRAVGFPMLARAGVTCCLECGGFIEDILEGMALYGAGISVAVLNRLDPGVSISGPNAGKKELAEYLDRSLTAGAFGLKLVGGHHPLTPETTASAIEAVNQAGAYAAFHCGTTKNGSNLNGLLETLEWNFSRVGEPNSEESRYSNLPQGGRVRGQQGRDAGRGPGRVHAGSKGNP
jgi:dihydroorotase-like cyclic amidohydrolase